MSLFDRILKARCISSELIKEFLSPEYSNSYDPFLLPDMKKAVERLVLANKQQEHITIYGDYDIDGLTATALLLDAFDSFGFKKVDTYMPNRFVEGYGLTIEAVEKIADKGAKLIITVDCGSLSEKEIIRANELGVDVIVTDHHNVANIQPPALAVINPKRTDHSYPFIDLAGVGVAFKLIQALQVYLNGLPNGQEKWLLDLVALGTVCDIVPLVDENRTNVYWGLKVLSKTRRPGLKALMSVAKVDPQKINSRSLGFSLGPRMNAAGRLETAQYSLNMLISKNSVSALEAAQYLDVLNVSRRVEQDKIFKQAIVQAEKCYDDLVLVVSDASWNHGVVGIVASKLLEKYKKPTFVLQEMGDKSKGSARSYGDFSAADAIEASKDLVIKGGGHKFAAGITLLTENIDAFRVRVNEFYRSQGLINQKSLLLPKADVSATLLEITEESITLINQLEPFGQDNPQPIIKSDDLIVVNIRKMGVDNKHIKLELQDKNGVRMNFLAFNAPTYFFVEIGAIIDVWYCPDVNIWQGMKSVEGRLLHLEIKE
ncbi:MAG: single-stranded-DNA-specific exonuclease [Patescibacteria group bacterium]|nr:single-stranded-DNA-specific exonuclease [Patescibacteria group bacterium]